LSNTCTAVFRFSFLVAFQTLLPRDRTGSYSLKSAFCPPECGKAFFLFLYLHRHLCRKFSSCERRLSNDFCVGECFARPDWPFPQHYQIKGFFFLGLFLTIQRFSRESFFSLMSQKNPFLSVLIRAEVLLIFLRQGPISGSFFLSNHTLFFSPSQVLPSQPPPPLAPFSLISFFSSPPPDLFNSTPRPLKLFFTSFFFRGVNIGIVFFMKSALFRPSCRRCHVASLLLDFFSARRVRPRSILPPPMTTSPC